MLGLVAVVVAVALAVSLVVMRGGATTSTPSPSYLLSRIVATSATQRMGTVHIRETVRNYYERIPEDITEDLQPATGVAREVITSPSWPAGTKVTVLLVGSTGYAKATVPSPVTGAGEWLAGPFGGVASPAPIPPGSPGQLHAVEGPVSALGHRSIAGTAVTGYRITIDLQALIRDAPTTYLAWLYQTLYLGQGITRFPAEVWLDNQGRVRELTWQVRYWFQPKNRPAKVTQIYSYHNRVLSIAVPPASQTTKEPGVAAAIGQAIAQVDTSLDFAKAHVHA